MATEDIVDRLNRASAEAAKGHVASNIHELLQEASWAIVAGFKDTAEARAKAAKGKGLMVAQEERIIQLEKQLEKLATRDGEGSELMAYYAVPQDLILSSLRWLLTHRNWCQNVGEGQEDESLLAVAEIVNRLVEEWKSLTGIENIELDTDGLDTT
jgi:hypothetical protein